MKNTLTKEQLIAIGKEAGILPILLTYEDNLTVLAKFAELLQANSGNAVDERAAFLVQVLRGHDVLVEELDEAANMIESMSASLANKPETGLYNHEDVARLLITIGWRCDGDAQWTRIKEAIPRLRSMLQAITKG